MSNKPFDIKMYESSTCPAGSFYFVDDQMLKEVKKLDEWFKRLKKIDKRNVVLNSVDVSSFMFLERNSRREDRLE